MPDYDYHGLMASTWDIWRDDTEQRFEVELNGTVVQTECHRRSPEGRWYSLAQAAGLFRAAGYAHIRLFHGFTQEPAREEDRLYCVLGER